MSGRATEDSTGATVGTVHSLLWGEFPGYVVVHDKRVLTRRQLLRSVLRAQSGDAILLNGALGFHYRYQDLLVGLLLRLLRPGVALVLTDATWTARSLPGEARSRRRTVLLATINKAMLRAVAGPRTHVCLLTEAEADQFTRESGHPRARTHVTPFPVSLGLPEIEAVGPVERGGYVFVGGDTLRDWDLLRAALAGTDLPVRIATRRATGDWPAGVQAGPTDHEGFLRLLVHCDVLCLPLVTGTVRSMGQQTYLNGMLLGKPVVITRAAGARDELPEDAAYLVDADPLALRAALLTAFAGGPEVEELAARGRRLAEGRSVAAYNRQLAEIARTAADH